MRIFYIRGGLIVHCSLPSFSAASNQFKMTPECSLPAIVQNSSEVSLLASPMSRTNESSDRANVSL